MRAWQKQGAEQEIIMWKHLKDWWKTEGAMVQLQGLDDRLLADMGLDRDGLRERVRGEAERPGDGSAPPGRCGLRGVLGAP
jgi:uncharacterized protein YjiS (DUF1127 family)